MLSRTSKTARWAAAGLSLAFPADLFQDIQQLMQFFHWSKGWGQTGNHAAGLEERGIRQLQVCPVIPTGDRLNTAGGSDQADPGAIQEIDSKGRQFSVPVPQFVFEVIKPCFGRDGGKPAVGIDPQFRRIDIVFCKCSACLVFRRTSGKHKEIHKKIRFRRSFQRFAFQLSHAAAQKFAVKMKSHRMDLPALFRTENISRAADLQVPDCQFESGAEMGIAPDGR